MENYLKKAYNITILAKYGENNFYFRLDGTK